MGLSRINEGLPVVSIVVPLRNEELFISLCLQALVAQDYPADKLEIIVVDGASEDKSAAIVEEFAARHSNIMLLLNGRKITPVARNIGIGNAGGEYIAIIDSHSRIDPGYIRETTAIMRNHPEIDCVGGAMKTIGLGFWGQAAAAALASPFGVGDSKFRTSDREALVDTVAFPVYRRSVFDKIGTFDERLARNQDNDFNFRLRRDDGKILLTPKVNSYYYAPPTLYKFCRQAWRNGFWNLRLTRLVGQGLSLRHFVPLAFVIALLVSLGGWIFAGEGRPFVALAIVYGAAAVLASLAGGEKNGWRYVPVLPILFLLLHLSYGLGSAAGLVEIFAGSGARRPEAAGTGSIKKPATQKEKVQ